MDYSEAALGAFLAAAPPSRKPFLKRRWTDLRLAQRPVPVVFLRLALRPQL
jgi:hypothetical protein